jgi:hypothetical protein
LTPEERTHLENTAADSPAGLYGIFKAVPDVVKKLFGDKRAEEIEKALEKLLTPEDLQMFNTPLPKWGTGALDPKDYPKQS